MNVAIEAVWTFFRLKAVVFIEKKKRGIVSWVLQKHAVWEVLLGASFRNCRTDTERHTERRLRVTQPGLHKLFLLKAPLDCSIVDVKNGSNLFTETWQRLAEHEVKQKATGTKV